VNDFREQKQGGLITKAHSQDCPKFWAVVKSSLSSSQDSNNDSIFKMSNQSDLDRKMIATQRSK
jgi:hypothetical protein